MGDTSLCRPLGKAYPAKVGLLDIDVRHDYKALDFNF